MQFHLNVISSTSQLVDRLMIYIIRERFYLEVGPRNNSSSQKRG